MIKEELDSGKVVVIHDFLSGEECVALIRRSEDLIYEPGTVADVVIEDVRNNKRVLVDVTLAADLFSRAEPFLPAVFEWYGLVGFNERWRFYRYQPGQTFRPHRDEWYMRMPSWEESQLTFLIYLNEGMTGGETRFLRRHGADIPPTSLPVCAAERRNGTHVHACHLARRCRRAQWEKICAAHGCHGSAGLDDIARDEGPGDA